MKASFQKEDSNSHIKFTENASINSPEIRMMTQDSTNTTLISVELNTGDLYFSKLSKNPSTGIIIEEINPPRTKINLGDERYRFLYCYQNKNLCIIVYFDNPLLPGDFLSIRLFNPQIFSSLAFTKSIQASQLDTASISTFDDTNILAMLTEEISIIKLFDLTKESPDSNIKNYEMGVERGL